MMNHRKEIHPEKVKYCKDPVSCGFKVCWFLHSKEQVEQGETNPSKTHQPDSESNFQNVPEQPKPPFNQNC